MELSSFVAKINWEIESKIGNIINKISVKKNQIFEADDNGYYIIKSNENKVMLSKEDMIGLIDNNGDNIFEQINKNINIIIEEIDELDDNLISNWRIQLDVKTTRKKLKLINDAFEKYIKPIVL